MIKELNVQNIKCGGCVHTITDELSHIAGVSRVEVSREKAVVKFVVEHTEDVVWVADHLIKIGYPPIGQKDRVLDTLQGS